MLEEAARRERALLDGVPDPLLRVSREGTVLDVHVTGPSALARPPHELIGRNVGELVPPELAEPLLSALELALENHGPATLEYELEIDGVRRWRESRITPSGEEVVIAVRDFTDERRANVEQQRLVEEQAALRRVATLAAGDSAPDQVFQAVTAEVCRLLGLRTAVLHRFEDEWTSTIVGRFGDPTGTFDLGNTIQLEDGAALWVLQSGAPAHSNYDELTGPGAAELRALGFHSSVGVPISVAGVTWGALVAAFRAGETLPLETERRLTAFAELVALAVASAHSRAELAASRLRIVEASDAERRRIERNLHDGAQQRLVALSVALRLAQAKTQTAPSEAKELLELAAAELNETLAELRELAQGIHPAILTERGLEAALEVLVARTPLRVALELRLPRDIPEPVEAAAYYVVSESLANIVKHAGATSASVRVGQTDGQTRVEVKDNGAGGADPGRGSGLCGLRDRVEALDGTFTIESRPGRGTRVVAELPARSP